MGRNRLSLQLESKNIISRHGEGAPAMCGRPLMSALILWPFHIKKKGQEHWRWRVKCSKMEHEPNSCGRDDFCSIPLRVHGKVVILQPEISQESGMTFRKSARWPIVSVRLTSCVLRHVIISREQICKQISRVNCFRLFLFPSVRHYIGQIFFLLSQGQSLLQSIRQ